MSKLKKIRPKMLFSLLSTFAIVLGIFLILVIVRTNSLSEELAIELTRNTAENYANQMAIEFEKTDNLVLGLKLAAEQSAEIPAENRRAYLDRLLEQTVADQNTGVLGAWAAFEENRLDGRDQQFQNTEMSDALGRYCTYFFNAGSGVEQTPLADFDVPGTGDFYLVPRQTGKPFVTPPFDYPIGDKTFSVVSIAHPVKDSTGETIGVIGVDYTLDYFNELNSQIELYDNGYGKLITDQGITVAHFDESYRNKPDSDLTNSEVSDAIKASLAAGTTWVGQSYARVVDALAYKAFANVSLGTSGINWSYAVVAPKSEVLSSTNQTVIMVSFVALFGLLAASVIIILLSNSISRPLKSMCGIADKIASGDLTAVIPTGLLAKQDELGDLSNYLKGMQEALLETVSGINHASYDLNDQVTTIKDAVNDLNDRITDTSASTEELSAGMEETGASAEEMNATANEIENAVSIVAEKSEEGAGRSSEIQTRAEELGKQVNTSIQKSNQIFQDIKVALEKALADSKAVDEINVLADAILSIASQTTLLALNASIEAARAGEAGRGFDIVANEISHLADSSKNTVTQIQTITRVVMSAVGALADSSSELLSFVAEHVQKDYQDMLKAAESYQDDAVYLSDMTSDLNATSEELLASTQILIRTIGEVAMAAQEGAKTTATVAEQTTEISVNASTVAENMKYTENTATKLTALVNKFILNS